MMRPIIISAALLMLSASAAHGQGTSDRVFGQVVVIEVTDAVDEIQRDEIARRVPQLMGPGEYVTRFTTGTEGQLFARVAPVPDVQAFAAKIDFGSVTKIEGRRITVRAKPVQGAGTAAATPLNRALEGIKSSNADIRDSALEQLAQMKPDQRRGEVLTALRGPLTSTDTRANALAVQALGVWGTQENLPTLIKALDSRDGLTRKKGIEALARFKDLATIEPIARRLGSSYDGSAAVEALIKLGPASEKTALRALTSKDERVRRDACKILEKIGTSDSLATLTAAKQDSDAFVRVGAEQAVRAITRRQQPSLIRPRRN
jgi:hypothetical protein